LLLEGLDGGLHEGRHETKLDTVLLGESILNLLTGVHDGGHVDFVEGGQASVGVLGFLQATRDGLTHLAHLNAGLKTLATDLTWSLLGNDSGHVWSAGWHLSGLRGSLWWGWCWSGWSWGGGNWSWLSLGWFSSLGWLWGSFLLRGWSAGGGSTLWIDVYEGGTNWDGVTLLTMVLGDNTIEGSKDINGDLIGLDLCDNVIGLNGGTRL